MTDLVFIQRAINRFPIYHDRPKYDFLKTLFHSPALHWMRGASFLYDHNNTKARSHLWPRPLLLSESCPSTSPRDNRAPVPHRVVFALRLLCASQASRLRTTSTTMFSISGAPRLHPPLLTLRLQERSCAQLHNRNPTFIHRQSVLLLKIINLMIKLIKKKIYKEIIRGESPQP